MRFLARRALHSAALLISVSIISLALLKLAPGDYFETMRLNPQISTQALIARRSEAGLDKPLPILYWRWLRSAANGEWGFSFAYNGPAGPILWPRVRNTITLAFCASLLAWVIAMPLGVVAGARLLPGAGLLTSTITVVLLAIPEVVLALGVFLLATRYSGAVGLKSLPASIMGPVVSSSLPVLCLCMALLPLFVSHIRASVAETLKRPFVTAAKSFGISDSRILLRYVLPAAINPMLSLIGLSIGLLLSSSVIVEGVFGWPGLGQLMLEAISDRDMFLIVDSAILAAGCLLVGNFVADALLYLTDPRMRAQ